MTTRTFKRGDSVFHRPTGETWYLVEDERDGLVTSVTAAGWLASPGRAEDCKLIAAVEEVRTEPVSSSPHETD